MQRSSDLQVFLRSADGQLMFNLLDWKESWCFQYSLKLIQTIYRWLTTHNSVRSGMAQHPNWSAAKSSEKTGSPDFLGQETTVFEKNSSRLLCGGSNHRVWVPGFFVSPSSCGAPISILLMSRLSPSGHFKNRPRPFGPFPPKPSPGLESPKKAFSPLRAFPCL